MDANKALKFARLNRYDLAIEALKEEKPMTVYTITRNSGMMPNQIEGHTDDGRHFYFRARHDWACLYIHESLDACYAGDELGPNKSIVWGKYIDGAGWFELDEFEALFWKVIEEIEA